LQKTEYYSDLKFAQQFLSICYSLSLPIFFSPDSLKKSMCTALIFLSESGEKKIGGLMNNKIDRKLLWQIQVAVYSTVA